MEYWTPQTTAYGGTRCNFWGYSTVNYFAPMARYASEPMDGRSVCREARALRVPCQELRRGSSACASQLALPTAPPRCASLAHSFAASSDAPPYPRALTLCTCIRLPARFSLS